MVEFRRKLYKRGSSFETTIPMPLLFALDTAQKHDVLFRFDSKAGRWYVEFEQAMEKADASLKRKREHEKNEKRQ